MRSFRAFASYDMRQDFNVKESTSRLQDYDSTSHRSCTCQPLVFVRSEAFSVAGMGLTLQRHTAPGESLS